MEGEMESEVELEMKTQINYAALAEGGGEINYEKSL